MGTLSRPPRWWQLQPPAVLTDHTAALGAHTSPALPDPGQSVVSVDGVNPGRRPPVGPPGVDAGRRDHHDPAEVGRTTRNSADRAECAVCGHDFNRRYSPELDVCQQCVVVTPC